MKIDRLTSSSSELILNAPRPVSSGVEGAPVAKSLGEIPPVILTLDEIGKLAQHFLPGGLVERFRKRLNHLKNKNCKVVPAKGCVACVDDKDVVYLGVDFLGEYEGELETIAGVLGHEWGHACAEKPHQEKIQSLNWDQIFELRRAHETLADEISGRLLCRMGYSPEGVVKFLKKGRETHNLKYHDPHIREQVIRYGFESEKRKVALAQSLFDSSSYKNEYNSILLDIV